jgi:hypothetical protein
MREALPLSREREHDIGGANTAARDLGERDRMDLGMRVFNLATLRRQP